MTHMLQIGLTGGIGSGKTTVAQLFELLGIPVYYADDRAKHLMQQDKDVRRQITAQFGEEVYDRDGRLNRKFLAGQVFEDREKLVKLNSIVHPAVGRDFVQWCERQSGAAYVIKEAALIFETHGEKRLDRTILVWAPEEMRVQRVVSRDDVTAEAVRARMDNQLTDHEKVPRSDFVLVNDGAHSLVRQVTEVHRLLSAMSTKGESAQPV